MSRTLILMRHAKSSWDAPELSDHDRPLNARGRASATAMGGWLRTRGHVPHTCISSSATRTGQTFAHLALEVPVRFTRNLYHADPGTMMQVLHRQHEAVVLMLGHNPGIAAFAHRLVRTAPQHGRFADYPTAATTVIHWNVERWDAIGWGQGDVQDFAIPREVLCDS